MHLDSSQVIPLPQKYHAPGSAAHSTHPVLTPLLSYLPPLFLLSPFLSPFVLTIISRNYILPLWLEEAEAGLVCLLHPASSTGGRSEPQSPEALRKRKRNLEQRCGNSGGIKIQSSKSLLVVITLGLRGKPGTLVWGCYQMDPW